MTVVHRIGFATRSDALDFAKAVWAYQSLNDSQIYCELCFDTNSVELVGLDSDIELIVGKLPALEDAPREC